MEIFNPEIYGKKLSDSEYGVIGIKDEDQVLNLLVKDKGISKHKISNITFDKVMFRTIRESDGKVCETHELIADRTYEDGTVDKQVTCIVNQREYEEIQKYGYYNVYDELEENNK